MNYLDGPEVRLGDVVRVPTPAGERRARVVMLGDTGQHLDRDAGFVRWVRDSRILAPTSVFIEWLDDNPFAHDDPQLAPVGNYMSTTVDEFVRFESRSS